MPTSEEQDLDALHQQCNIIRHQAFGHFRYILSCGPADLANSGHKSIEAAVLYTVKDTIKHLNKLTAAFIKKWPDGGSK